MQRILQEQTVQKSQNGYFELLARSEKYSGQLKYGEQSQEHQHKQVNRTTEEKPRGNQNSESDIKTETTQQVKPGHTGPSPSYNHNLQNAT